ncbi:DeoR/GlpR family DNA-binding transcription regulator [Lacticaseibacillus baoqingensis]|uniref:DeoR/GlpR family DNA-binding transcription regulator n=1 Tax=Lacticaseibacillus baoqingensis TaxID=2486013 RepID=A0ABW4EBQ6_9LACO|nr:DeoR/GlpR family DNA-binding transcription regulator [Lacticaseibacillus baoqingensis]
MIEKERQFYILSRLQSQPTVSIKELCLEMKVSKSTVQRDLEHLEAQGKIKRARGGATRIGFEKTISDLTEGPVSTKIGVNTEAKKVIAKAAAAQIKDGDLVFIDSGTTVLELMPFLSHKSIKIVTYSVILLSYLGSAASDVYLLGGKYSPKHQICTGPAAINELMAFRFDKAIISANGVDAELGEAYTSEIDVGDLKHRAIERAKQSFLLVDATKFGETGLSTFAHFEDFQQVITDQPIKGSRRYKNIVIAK